MATLVKETGAGVMTANAYANVADSDSYHDARLYSTAWTGASAADKARALIWATSLLDQHMDWRGWKVDEDQALRWPRSGVFDRDGYYIESDEIPTVLVDATCEMARYLLETNPTTEPDTLGIKAVKAGDVAVDFDPLDRESRSVIPVSVQALLGGVGAADSPAGGFVKVVRV